MLTLRDAITASGAKLIFHAPPITDMYLESFDRPEVKPDWCLLRERLEAPGVLFHDDFDGADFKPKDFSDWAHLNKAGARRYLKRVLKSAREGSGRPGTWCER